MESLGEPRLDPDLAPPGHHVLHAYTPATEPWEDWAELDEPHRRTEACHSSFGVVLARKSDEYKRKKQEAREFLFSAVAKQVPDLEATWQGDLVRCLSMSPARLVAWLRTSRARFIVRGPCGLGDGGHASHAPTLPTKALWHLWTHCLSERAE